MITGGTSSTSPVQQVAGAGTVGQVLMSSGPGALPAWTTLSGGSIISFPITVPEGGTGGTQATAYALLAGGTSASAPLQQVAGVGGSGQVLTSQGAGLLPQWAASTGGSVSFPVTVPEGGTGGTAVTAYALVAGGTSPSSPLQVVAGTATTGYVLTGNGAGALPSWQQNTGGSIGIPVTVTEGGTGGTTATAYAVIAGGTANTAPFQQVPGVGSTGQILTSRGAGLLPTWQTNAGGSVGTGAAGEVLSNT